MSTCTNCCGCKNDRTDELKNIIDSYKDTNGALIPVLHKAQELYGYLPVEALKEISQGLNISMAEIYGVVTFYKHFSLKPKGEYRIQVCLGTACYVRGAGEILEKFKEALKIEVGECTEDGKFSLSDTRCLGACGLAPVVMINDDVYGKVKTNEIEKILEKYM